VLTALLLEIALAVVAFRRSGPAGRTADPPQAPAGRAAGGSFHRGSDAPSDPDGKMPGSKPMHRRGELAGGAPLSQPLEVSRTEAVRPTGATHFFILTDPPGAASSGIAESDAIPSPPPTPPGGPLPGRGLHPLDGDGRPMEGLLPVRTEVTAFISGESAWTEIRQEYVNPHEEDVDFAYGFPIPPSAAPCSFTLKSEDTRIECLYRPRADAARLYQEARSCGRPVSLLVAGVPASLHIPLEGFWIGGDVEVTFSYRQRLHGGGSRYEYVFPLDSKRFPRILDEPETPGGISGSPAPPPRRSGANLDLTVDLKAGFPLKRVESPSHEVDLFDQGVGRRLVTLLHRPELPEGDFVLSWELDIPEIRASALLAREGSGGTVLVLGAAPENTPEDRIIPREVHVLLDRSGSMRGEPGEASAHFARTLMRGLGPKDTFNLHCFARYSRSLWKNPRKPTTDNMEAAKLFLHYPYGNAGGDLTACVRWILANDLEPGTLRIFVLCTDGWIGEERSLAKVLPTLPEHHRFHVFGVGRRVRTGLLESLARLGGGRCALSAPETEAEGLLAAERFAEEFGPPVAASLTVDWGELPVQHPTPGLPVDLHAGGTIAFFARLDDPLEGDVFLEGWDVLGPVRVPVTIAAHPAAEIRPEVSGAWATRRIGDLCHDLYRCRNAVKGESIARRILSLSEREGVPCALTVFASDAADSSRAGIPD